MSIITLTTDYGLKDHFVGALKGKILTENPEAKQSITSKSGELFLSHDSKASPLSISSMTL
mgnify:CR=1 FL=1